MDTLRYFYQYHFSIEKTRQMKLSNMYAYLIGLPLLLFMLTACDLELPSNSCANCFEEKPTVGLISVSVSPTIENDSIPIRILKGKLEDGQLYLQDTLSEGLVEFWVEVGYFYTVEATYFSEGKKVLVVDGDKVTVYLDQSNCDFDCWRPNDGRANCKMD